MPNLKKIKNESKNIFVKPMNYRRSFITFFIWKKRISNYEKKK